MKLANVLATSTVLGGLLLAPSAPRAATFVNNGFETGDPTGWTVGEGFRGGITNSNLSPTTIGAGSLGHSGIIDTAYIDPHEPLMVEGERTRFWIPQELAYKGEAGSPRGMLVFDIDLIKIE